MKKNYVFWFALLAIILLGCRQEFDSLGNETASKPDVYLEHRKSSEFSRNLNLANRLSSAVKELSKSSVVGKSTDTT
ncbi:hypothetical protein D3C87_720550 [compost metagenome]